MRRRASISDDRVRKSKVVRRGSQKPRRGGARNQSRLAVPLVHLWVKIVQQPGAVQSRPIVGGGAGFRGAKSRPPAPTGSGLFTRRGDALRFVLALQRRVQRRRESSRAVRPVSPDVHGYRGAGFEGQRGGCSRHE